MGCQRYPYAIRDVQAANDGRGDCACRARGRRRGLGVRAAAGDGLDVRLVEAPGDPELAREIAALLGAELETERGWDHGLWVPMLHILPDARTPIVEIALPRAANLLQIGRALAPLREHGIAIAGSGGIVHNLRILDLANKNAPPLEWAVEFDQWIAERLATRDFEAIVNYESAPNARLAVPTPEHFEPLLIVLGASHADDRLESIYEGFQYATLSMRSMAFV